MTVFSEIGFCDKVVHNIVNDDLKQQIMERLEKYYTIDVLSKRNIYFNQQQASRMNMVQDKSKVEIACCPQKFTSEKIGILKNNPHLYCLSGNGNNYLLFITRNLGNFMHMCIFVDRKIHPGYTYPRMVVVNLMFQESLYEDTCIEGEMIHSHTPGEKRKWTFHTSDILVHRGFILSDVNLPRRISILYNILQKQLQHNSLLVPFQVTAKQYFKYTEHNELMTYVRDECPFEVRGIVAKPLFLKFVPILIPISKKQLKGTSVGDKTSVDAAMPRKQFVVTRSHHPDVYFLTQAGKMDTLQACIPSLKVSKYMSSLFSKEGHDNVLVNCYYDSSKFNKWIPEVPVAVTE